jgi:benzoate membrane transport protein
MATDSTPLATDARPRSALGSYWRDLNPPAAWAGLTTFIWYAVGLVPVQIAVTGQLGLSADQVSSWIFIIWFSGSIASIGLSLVYRQPIPITTTIPGLIFLGTLAGRFSFPELVGANIMAGVVIVALAVLGIGGHIPKLLPMPVAMGMLAGSIMADVTHMVDATVDDLVVAGATVVGYFLGRLLRNPRIPPVGLALLAGGLAVALAGRASPAPINWELPSLVVPGVAFSASAFAAVSIPLIVLSMGLGNVQGLGFLIAQGYKVPVNATTFVLGVNSIVNALFGGHAAIVSRNGMPIMAGPEAGPVQGRYWANLISATLSLLIALAAGPVASMFGVLPRGYIIALAGLAIMPSLQNALERAFGEKLRFGAVVAFVVAATPFAFFGITSAFWALLAGVSASLLAEREELLAHWRGETKHDGERRESARVPVAVQPTSVARVAGRQRVRLRAVVRDLGANGLLVRSEQRLVAGNVLELTFGLPVSGVEMRVRVDVRRVDHVQSEPTDLWEAGCEFREISPDARERLLSFVEDQRQILGPQAAEPVASPAGDSGAMAAADTPAAVVALPKVRTPRKAA